VVFVLPNGGSAGAVQVGVLQSMLEAGIYPDALVACSVGALNAAYMAADPSLDQVRRMAEGWTGVTPQDVFGFEWHRAAARLVRRLDHLCSPDPLRALIRRACPVDDLSELTVPLHVVTTDLDLGVSRWWTQGPAEDIIYASACLPGLLPPAVLDGSRHVDGGVLDPVPVARAVDLDASRVYVIGEPPEPGERRPGRTALDILLRSFTISRYGRLPNPAALARPGQQVIVVPGAGTGDIPIRDFSRTTELIEESRARSSRFLERHLAA
jgi:NTE family protein